MLQLFTDTSANLPVALTKQHHITVVPFSYTVDGKETDYPDDVDFDGAAFYGAMRRGAVVKTSMVNPALMANYFEPFKKRCRSRYCCKGDAHLLKSRFLFNLCSIAQPITKGKRKSAP